MIKDSTRSKHCITFAAGDLNEEKFELTTGVLQALKNYMCELLVMTHTQANDPENWVKCLVTLDSEHIGNAFYQFGATDYFDPEADFVIELPEELVHEN